MSESVSVVNPNPECVTDIVERLRAPRRMEGGLPVGECYGCYDEIKREAADEIERLRTVLKNIADYNIGTRIKPGETPDAANIRAIRDIAKECL